MSPADPSPLDCRDKPGNDRNVGDRPKSRVVRRTDAPPHHALLDPRDKPGDDKFSFYEHPLVPPQFRHL